ncbi:MAG: HD-GYP domain-containing protein [Candidatus Saccharicenans sp.]|uniref:HD-GYP domain-containing protein n=1 Tax=Candidatus Saccharicenans sp. TaxID=2819258 RepID=UPI00404B81B3
MGGMKDKVRRCYLLLMNAIQAGRIYSTDHPKFQEFIGQLYSNLMKLLESRQELTLGIVGGELVWEDEIFFDLSGKLTGLISFLGENRIERMVFSQGLSPEELRQFIISLTRTRKSEQGEEKEKEKEGPDLNGFQHIRAGRLRASVQNKLSGGEETELKKKYFDAVQVVDQSLNLVLNEHEVDYLDLRFNLLNIMENFFGRHQELLNLVSVKKRDLITFVHLLNVTMLVMFFASRLGLARDDVLDLGLAALYHDIGKLYISKKIIKKKGRLTEAEFQQVQTHPIIGARILQGYKETLGYLPMVAAFEHHLRYDLSGYPRLPFTRKPHLASMMISICDVYDALALKRSYKKEYPPDKIYELMMMEKGKAFPPELLDKFFQFVGLWPVGTVVLLNDGRVGVVRQVNEQDIARPVVEIIAPQSNGEQIDLSLNGQLSIIRALDPRSEGKKYLKYLRGVAPAEIPS